MGKQKNYTTEIQYGELMILEIDESTADMYYHFIGYGNDDNGEKMSIYSKEAYETRKSEKDTPAWSLAALLNLLPKEYRVDSQKKHIHDDFFLEITVNPDKEEWIVQYITKDHKHNDIKYNGKHLIDAVYKMVKRLLRDGVYL